MIINSVNDITLNQYTYSELMNETEQLKKKLLVKLKKEDKDVKAFVESKLYYILRSELTGNIEAKYNTFLSFAEGTFRLTKEVFIALMEE